MPFSKFHKLKELANRLFLEGRTEQNGTLNLSRFTLDRNRTLSEKVKPDLS